MGCQRSTNINGQRGNGQNKVGNTWSRIHSADDDVHDVMTPHTRIRPVFSFKYVLVTFYTEYIKHLYSTHGQRPQRLTKGYLHDNISVPISVMLFRCLTFSYFSNHF